MTYHDIITAKEPEGTAKSACIRAFFSSLCGCALGFVLRCTKGHAETPIAPIFFFLFNFCSCRCAMLAVGAPGSSAARRASVLPFCVRPAVRFFAQVPDIGHQLPLRRLQTGPFLIQRQRQVVNHRAGADRRRRDCFQLLRVVKQSWELFI